MPNIIVQLRDEMLRVQLLLLRFDPIRKKDAEAALRYASDCMALNSLDGMMAAVADLKEFKL